MVFAGRNRRATSLPKFAAKTPRHREKRRQVAALQNSHAAGPHRTAHPPHHEGRSAGLPRLARRTGSSPRGTHRIGRRTAPPSKCPRAGNRVAQVPRRPTAGRPPGAGVGQRTAACASTTKSHFHRLAELLDMESRAEAQQAAAGRPAAFRHRGRNAPAIASSTWS